jgi:hypothetical protein
VNSQSGGNARDSSDADSYDVQRGRTQQDQAVSAASGYLQGLAGNSGPHDPGLSHGPSYIAGDFHSPGTSADPHGGHDPSHDPGMSDPQHGPGMSHDPGMSYEPSHDPGLAAHDAGNHDPGAAAHDAGAHDAAAHDAAAAAYHP